MNTLQRNQRKQRGLKPQFDYLDNRIVPAALLPHMVVAADVAHTNVIAHSQHQDLAAASAASLIQNRHELRLERLADRREQARAHREEAMAQRELRQARTNALFSARHHFTLAVQPAVQMVTSVLTFPSVGATGQAPGTPSSTTISPVPVSTTGSSSSSSGTTTGSTSPTRLLPPNASQQLETDYEEFLNGQLPTTTNQPGQPVIEGKNVEVEIHTNNPSEFNSTVAAEVSLGLQVTASAPAYDMVVGFLPIAQLPAAAQVSGAPSLTAVTYPELK